jgi:hypothetical protein
VTIDHIKEARQQMILARETHLDSLLHRLEDPRIYKIMETIVSGATDTQLVQSDAFRICLDLGLVTVERNVPQIANPMYREVIAREMTYGIQIAIPEPAWHWEKEGGGLDMDRLLKEFQKFWRRHSEIWEQQANYTEAFPHLLLMAFLQRILNGGGNIEREYAAGRGRMDLLVEFGTARFIIEVKLIHSYDTPQIVREEGLEQIGFYRDRMGHEIPSYLVIFDRRPEKLSWDKRITWSKEGDITLVGC